jgi:hypothetical protein
MTSRWTQHSPQMPSKNRRKDWLTVIALQFYLIWSRLEWASFCSPAVCRFYLPRCELRKVFLLPIYLCAVEQPSPLPHKMSAPRAPSNTAAAKRVAGVAPPAATAPKRTPSIPRAAGVAGPTGVPAVKTASASSSAAAAVKKGPAAPATAAGGISNGTTDMARTEMHGAGYEDDFGGAQVTAAQARAKMIDDLDDFEARLAAGPESARRPPSSRSSATSGGRVSSRSTPVIPSVLAAAASAAGAALGAPVGPPGAALRRQQQRQKQIAAEGGNAITSVGEAAAAVATVVGAVGSAARAGSANAAPAVTEEEQERLDDISAVRALPGDSDSD